MYRAMNLGTPHHLAPSDPQFRAGALLYQRPLARQVLFVAQR
jgi:hypothetical protein